MSDQIISITLNGEAKEVKSSDTGVQLFEDDKNIIAVRLNGQPRDLYTPLKDGDSVEPIALDSPDGLAIMRHSATHVMAQAVQDLHEQGSPAFDTAMPILSQLLNIGSMKARVVCIWLI